MGIGGQRGLRPPGDVIHTDRDLNLVGALQLNHLGRHNGRCVGVLQSGIEQGSWSSLMQL